jgi:hypothetical protein
MRLLLDLPDSWPRTRDGVTVAPGVSLRIHGFRPLPLDLEAWREAVIGKGVDRRALRVVAAVDRETQAGWPIALVVTEVGKTRRLHAFYRFLVHGCVAVLEGEARAFDRVMEPVKDVLVAARPDFSTERPVAIRDLFAGFDDGTAS